MKNNPPISGLEHSVLPTEILFFQTDLHGIITNANGTFAQVSGYTIKELVGASLEMVLHPDVPDNVTVDMRQTLESGKVWHGIVKHRCKNGDHYWVDTLAMPVRKGGTSCGYRWVHRHACPADIAATGKRFKQEGKPSRLLPGLPSGAAMAAAAVLFGVVLLAALIVAAMGLAHAEQVMSELRRLSMDDQVAKAVLLQRADEEWLLHRDLRIATALLVALALGGIAGGLMLWRNRVLLPLRGRVADLARMAEGTLTARIDVRGHGKIECLNRTAAAIQAQFHWLADQVRQGGKVAADQGSELRHIVIGLTDRGEEQHDRVHRVVDDVLDAKRAAALLAKRIEDFMDESAGAIASIERHATVAGTEAEIRSRLRRLAARLDNVVQAVIAENRVVVDRADEIEHEMRQVADWLVDHRGAMHELWRVADCLADAASASGKAAEGFEIG